MGKRQIPNPVIAVVSEILANTYSHSQLDNLFLQQDIPGMQPGGNKQDKCVQWFQRANASPNADSIQILGSVLENFMEVELAEASAQQHRGESRDRLKKMLSKYGMVYQTGGQILCSEPTQSSGNRPAVLCATPPLSHHQPIRQRPRLFVGSSREGLEIAYAIQENLEHDAESTVWNQGIFQLSGNTLTDLIEKLSAFDFAVFVFSPDDKVITRDMTSNSVRDNVLFELGLFIGRLGKERVFYAIPRATTDLHLPTDLLGITPGQFDPKRSDGNLVAALGPFCNQIRLAIRNKGAVAAIDH